LAGCTGYKPELNNKDTSFKFNEYHEIPYLKYEDIFDEKDNKQQHTGKYSDKTSDGAFDWSNMKSDMYHLTPIVNDMFKKITLDGKKINLPMSFAELGKEFRDFKNIDYSSLTDDVTPVTARDSNNNLIYIGKLDPYPKLKKWNVFMSIFDNENKFLIGIELNMENAMIYGLNNNGLLSTKELKVDDIGIGSTLGVFMDTYPTAEYDDDQNFFYIPNSIYENMAFFFENPYSFASDNKLEEITINNSSLLVICSNRNYEK